MAGGWGRGEGIHGSRYKTDLNPIPGGGLQRPPVRFFPSHRQTPGAIELKLSDFVGTFIAHILRKKILRVRSGHVTRTDHMTRPHLFFC